MIEFARSDTWCSCPCDQAGGAHVVVAARRFGAGWPFALAER